MLHNPHLQTFKRDALGAIVVREDVNIIMPAELVDIIFLDIDGVLLPFGDAATKTKNDDCFVDGCLFPNQTMDAFTALLSHLTSSCVTTHVNDNNNIAYNPKIVLSSTWRTQSDFIQDILSSFRAYAKASNNNNSAAAAIQELFNNGFFDITDPTYFTNRHEEIYKWVVGAQSNNNNNNNATNNRQGRAQYKQFILRSWIALDDEDIVHVETGLFEGEGVRIVEDAKKHAVKTISSVGLTLTNVELGIRLLEQQVLEYHSLYLEYHSLNTKKKKREI